MTFGNLPALRLSRREVLVAATTGSLLGVAWGSAFVAGELHTDHPTATYLRSRDTFSLLLESRSRRLLLIDHRGEPPDGLVDDVTATMLGLLRRRVDLALVNGPLLESLGSVWRETWHVAMIASLTDTGAHSLTGGVVALGDLAVTLDTWPTGSASDHAEWALTARHGLVALATGSSWPALADAPRWPETTFTIATAVGDAPASGSGLWGDIVIVPAEEVSPDLAEHMHARGDRVVRLYADDPLTVEVRADGASLPAAGP